MGLNTCLAALDHPRNGFSADVYRVLTFHQGMTDPQSPTPDANFALPVGMIGVDVRVDPTYRDVWVAGHSLQNGHYVYRVLAYHIPPGSPPQPFVDVSSNFGLTNADCYAKAMTMNFDGTAVYVTGSSEVGDGPYNALTARFDPASAQFTWGMSYNSNSLVPSAASVASIRVGGSCIGCPPVQNYVFVTGIYGQSAGEDLLTLCYRQDDGSPVSQQWVARYNGAANGTDRGVQVKASTQLIDNVERAVAVVTGTETDSLGFTNWVTLKYDSSDPPPPPIGPDKPPRWWILHPISVLQVAGDDAPAGLDFYQVGDPSLFRIFNTGTTRNVNNGPRNSDMMTIHYEETAP